jgi:hypothetical protein
MLVREKATGTELYVTEQDVKMYINSPAWEVVKETVKAPKEEVTEKPKATKEKKESILSKLFK